MRMKRKRLFWALIIAAALLLAGGAVYAANAVYGSVGDPLVTKSYLDSVLQPELEKAMQEQLDQTVADFRADAGEFAVVTLKNNDRFTCAIGTEIIMRSGYAVGYAPEGGDALADTTDGTALGHGKALQENHLYMVTEQGNGLTSWNDTVLLVAGEYTITG